MYVLINVFWLYNLNKYLVLMSPGVLRWKWSDYHSLHHCLRKSINLASWSALERDSKSVPTHDFPLWPEKEESTSSIIFFFRSNTVTLLRACMPVLVFYVSSFAMSKVSGTTWHVLPHITWLHLYTVVMTLKQHTTIFEPLNHLVTPIFHTEPVYITCIYEQPGNNGAILWLGYICSHSHCYSIL